MTQNIKNFIEEGEKEFEGFGKTKINGATFDYTNLYSKLKDWHSSRQISLIKMIVDDTILELGKINFLEDITGEENRKLTLERYRKFRDTISSKLKEVAN